MKISDEGTALLLREELADDGVVTTYYTITLASILSEASYMKISREDIMNGCFFFKVFLTAEAGEEIAEIVLAEPKRVSDSFKALLADIGFKTLQMKIS